MKLVDILARELAKWPDDCDALFQTSSGRVIGISDSDPDFTDKIGSFTLNDEGTDPHVTRAEWRSAVDAKIEAPQNDESKNVARIEWDGEGLPPIGTVCEYDARPAGKGDPLWVSVKVHYLSKWTIVIECISVPEGIKQENIGVELSIDVGFSTTSKFRPIRTQEQIAAEDREKARDFALNTMTGEGWTEGETEEQWQFRLKIVSEMLDMGYRKP